MATRVVEVANGVPGLAAETRGDVAETEQTRLSNGLEVISRRSALHSEVHGELFFPFRKCSMRFIALRDSRK